MSTKENVTAEQQSSEQREDDDAPENFHMVEKGAGSLLRVKKKIEHVMGIKDRQFIELEPEDNILVLYDFLNSKTTERVLILLIEEKRFMYMTKEFDDEFEVLFRGTYEQKPTTDDEEVNAIFDIDDD